MSINKIHNITYRKLSLPHRAYICREFVKKLFTCFVPRRSGSLRQTPVQPSSIAAYVSFPQFTYWFLAQLKVESFVLLRFFVLKLNRFLFPVSFFSRFSYVCMKSCLLFGSSKFRKRSTSGVVTVLCCINAFNTKNQYHSIFV